MTSRVLIASFVIVASCFFAAAVPAQQQSPPPLVIASMTGRDLFQFYCATCHGKDARGGGPAAAALKTSPADLTGISRRRDGRFPRPEIIAFVSDGKPMIAAHGSAEMPVWGPIFRALDPSDTRARVRIENLVGYLESIQTK
jgi:mono/diheme cytochrome c family protein